MTDIYHRFEYAQDNEDGSRTIVVTTFSNPEPWDYVLALFRRRPWPKSWHHEMQFYSYSELDWFEDRTETLVSVEMCELLERFYLDSYMRPGVKMIGRA